MQHLVSIGEAAYGRFTRKSAAKLLLFLEMTKFFQKKTPDFCIFGK